jgi:hypothetical protein
VRFVKFGGLGEFTLGVGYGRKGSDCKGGWIASGSFDSTQDDGNYKCNGRCKCKSRSSACGEGRQPKSYDKNNGNDKCKMQGFLHCATHDEAVSGFGRNDDRFGER